MSVKHLDITGVIKNVVPGVSVKHSDVIVVLIGATWFWSADKPSQEEEKELCHPQRHAYKASRKRNGCVLACSTKMLGGTLFTGEFCPPRIYYSLPLTVNKP